ncbi:MAG: glucosaminidase domain-containing protein [Chloroflexota bacterium]
MLHDRPDRVDPARCAAMDDQMRAPRPRALAERFAGATAELLRPLEQGILPSGRGLLRRGGVLMASSALVMAALFQPVAGATTDMAAAPSATEAASLASQNVQPAWADKGGPTPDVSTPKKFIAAVVPAAQDSERETGVPSSVTVAQAILESEWGRSGLSKKAQNYFGIKAAAGPGPAGVVNMDTWEVFGGKDTVIRDGFKAYHNLYESVMDHGRFLKQNPRYADAFKTGDPIEFARRMHKAGYATDPAYTGKIKSLIDSYGLAQYDIKK